MMKGCKQSLPHHAWTYVAYHSEHADGCMCAAEQMMGCGGCNEAIIGGQDEDSALHCIYQPITAH